MDAKNSWVLFLLLIPGVLGPGIAKADGGSGQGGAFRAAITSCREKLNLPAPTPGQKPQLTADQRTQLKACLAEAGVTWPHHRHHRGLASNPDFRVRMAACFAQDGVPAFTRGGGVTPTDAQKAEFKKCGTEIKASN